MHICSELQMTVKFTKYFLLITFGRNVLEIL